MCVVQASGFRGMGGNKCQRSFALEYACMYITTDRVMQVGKIGSSPHK